MNERWRIIQTMTPIELAMFAAIGGQVPGWLRDRAAKATAENLERRVLPLKRKIGPRSEIVRLIQSQRVHEVPPVPMSRTAARRLERARRRELAGRRVA